MKELLRQVDQAKAEWEALRSSEDSLLSAERQQKLRALWTYHSNALEGNTLTLGETIFFLKEGLTAEGRPLQDYVEAKNHAEAIDYLHDVVRGDRPISEGLIKELNALLLKGIEWTQAKSPQGKKVKKALHPGQYKTEPNHVLTLEGTIHSYVEPIHVASEMEALLKEYEQNQNRHPVLRAADLHYGLVRIHPFDDCNGRVARLLMNLVLIRATYPPAVIAVENRRVYLAALAQADQGNRRAFHELIGQAVLTTLRVMAE